MNKEYKIKLDLNKKLYNKKMAFNQFDENVNDFYIEVTKNNKVVKDLDKSIVTLVAIKPSGEVDAQFIEVKEGQIYANLKPSMCDLVGNYQAKAMIVLEGEIVTTDTINYSVNEDKIISRLNDDIVSDERFTLFTDALARLSTIEISEEQRMINEAERILSEENRKIEEAKRVEAELVRQHEEADRTKYDAIRESNENIRKQNESIRLANETNRIDEESKRVEEENKRKLAEEERNANYNFMTEDEERRRSEANTHKEAEVLRVQAETDRVNEEAKRRTTEQARVSAENTRVSNENTREANEVTRKNNETKRVEAETQRQNRYNSFIVDAEANANNFENYTNNAKVKEEERKSNELDRKSQEVQRISNENSRKANEVVREENETSRQNIFENKVDEVDKKIIELNTTKDNFISSVNTKVDNKISEIEVAKSDMTNTVSNKVNEVEARFNALTSSQQQDAEVVDARDGETSLKARLDRDIEKAKQVYVNVEGSHISTDSNVGYAKDIEILGNTIQDASNLADIRSVGDKVEGQELYEIPVLIRGKNLFDGIYRDNSFLQVTGGGIGNLGDASGHKATLNYVKLKPNSTYKFSTSNSQGIGIILFFYDKNKNYIRHVDTHIMPYTTLTTNENEYYIRWYGTDAKISNFTAVQIEEGTVATPYEPYQEDKLTILSPVQLEKVGDVADRIIEKDGVWGVEKNIVTKVLNGNEGAWHITNNGEYLKFGNYDVCTDAYFTAHSGKPVISDKFITGVNTGGERTQEQVMYYCHGDLRAELRISILASKVGSTGFGGWLKDNNVTIKYRLAQPTFIPLPHDQQIKLRTFANKTNISFLTEIEGTIKAQVPKSLGATVNTHTEQINNLNKELDRVKKLEESTVSTVTTESDFTTVEATSNGYFEDVKLEGKTLVNLFSVSSFSASSDRLYSNYSSAHAQDLTTGKLITAFNFSSRIVYLDVYNDTTWVKVVKIEPYKRVLVQLNGTEHIPRYLGLFADGWENTEVFKQELGKACFILEGDHTQNPPLYFEGLKSAGQSATTSEDTTDEIVVSSVNENLIPTPTYKLDIPVGTQTNTYANTIICKNIPIKPNTTYRVSCGEYINKGSIKGYPLRCMTFRDKYDGNNVHFNAYTHKNRIKENETQIFTTEADAKYLVITIGNFASVGNIEITELCLTESSVENPYVQHQSDKKPLLYYNNETQTWEKPILREWDSIEKHSDGKYYYHQRSGEVVLNGSENWAYQTSSDILLFYLNMPNAKGNQLELKTTYINLGSIDINNENIQINSLKNLIITINPTKLSTQDVQGFKQWLQANNVTVVYQLAEEKVYECTNIDLITYANETNYVIESGAIAPRTTLKVHSNISNVVSLLQKKVSLLESNITSYMITQNRLMLASRYNADTVSFKVDVATLRNSFEYDNDLYELILNNILVGKDNYNREYIENLIIFYWMDFVISDEMYSTLFEIIEEQHNPKIEEETPLI